MIKAYIFDLFGTLAYYTRKEKLREFLSREEHEHLLIARLDDSGLSEERMNQVVELINKTGFYLYDDSERVIQNLGGNYKLGMISNVYEITAKKARENFGAFLKNFDFIAFSSELGLMKPDPKIFIYTLNKLVVNPEEAVMIGDLIDRDIIPARQLNISTILIDRNIQTLKEVIEEVI